MASTYSRWRWLSSPGAPEARCSEKPRMVFSGVRSSYETCLMKSDFNRSAASSASPRSRSAASMRKRSVMSVKVTRLAPSGSGAQRQFQGWCGRCARPRPRSLLLRPRRRRHLLDQLVPHPGLAETLGRQARDLAHMRLALEFVGGEIPDAAVAKAALLEFQPPVRGSEHRDAFFQDVQRRRLHLLRRLETGASQRQPLLAATSS